MRKVHYTILLGASFFVIIGIWGGFNWGFKKGFVHGYKTDISDKSQEIVVDSTESLDIQVSEVLSSLSDINSSEPSGKFRNAVDTVYSTIIKKVSKKYGLSEDQTNEALKIYSNMSDSLVVDHFESLKEMSLHRKELGKSSFIDLKYSSVASDFHALLTDKVCLITTTVMTYVTMSPNYKVLLKNSCRVILEDIVYNWADSLKTHGLVLDIVESKHKIEQHTRRAISELATAQDEITESINRTYSRTFFEGYWIEWTSTANLDIEARSVVKAGFKLHEYYSVNIDPEKQLITIILPRAQILSNTPDYEIKNDEEGFFVGITKEKRNRAFSDLKMAIESTALNRGILEEAESNALDIVTYFYLPLTQLPGSRFDIQVEYNESLKNPSKILQ